MEEHMTSERIYFDDWDKTACLDTYIPDCGGDMRPALIAVPGGSYAEVCADREGEPVALEFLGRGMCAFVLYYHTGNRENAPASAPLLDLSRAVVHVRRNAKKYGVDPHKIYLAGFSAGGHLAGSLATMHNDPALLSELGIRKGENRPDGVILSYPVVSAMCPTHELSFECLLGKHFSDITEEEKEKWSLEFHVDGDTPPMFLWHTAEDAAVPPDGTLRLCLACRHAGITCETNIYPHGAHGIALADSRTSLGDKRWMIPHVTSWVDRAEEFLRSL